MNNFVDYLKGMQSELQALKTSASKSLANVSTTLSSVVTVNVGFYKTSDGSMDEVKIPTIRITPTSPPVIATATLAGSTTNGRGFLIQDVMPQDNQTGFKILMQASEADAQGVPVGTIKYIPVDFQVTATGPFSVDVTYEDLLA